ncbi:MAG TPA: ABC transporter permease subunit, partial [Myxococcaceae bacterium]|nr:ABC transporter permease subunit [Myxococcaceae bacterium]
MTGFGSLVWLYLRDLARRKLFWGLFLLMAAVIAYNVLQTRMMEEALGQGESWDIVTRQASSQLERLMTWLRPYLGVMVMLLAAQVAPESRKNGTTQFVLSQGVKRRVLAAAQFVALGSVLTVAVLILQVGFGVAGAKTGFMKAPELAFSWLTLLLPTLT